MQAELVAQGFDRHASALVRLADLKVTGQTYELSLPLPMQGVAVSDQVIAALLDAFSKLYRERYAFFFEGEPIEIVNLRVAAYGRNPAVTLARPETSGPDATPARKGERPVYFEGRGFLATAVYERTHLRPGMTIAGPAVIEEETSSVLVPPGDAASVLADLGLVVSLDAGTGGLR